MEFMLLSATRNSEKMLDFLDDNIVERIARFCPLGVAACLSVTSKRYSVLVSRLLPDLCDTSDLRLLVKDLESNVDSIWWGLTIWDETRQSSQVAVTTLALRGRYELSEWNRQKSRGEAAFEICDRNRPSDLPREIVRTIVEDAGSCFTWKKAQLTVKLFLKQTDSEENDDVINCEQVARAMQYRIMLHALTYTHAGCDSMSFVMSQRAEERLADVVLSQDRHWKSLQKHCPHPIDNVVSLGWLLRERLHYRKKLDIKLFKKIFLADQAQS